MSLDEKADQKYVRPTWDEYFMEVARAIAKRATCDRGRSGCVIAKDKQILTTGYVGSPPGEPHCDDVGHLMVSVVNSDGTVSQHCKRTIHAEDNAIKQAKNRGIDIRGATLYCKMTPCKDCAESIISHGLERVVCEKKYHRGAESEQRFKDAGITLEYVAEVVESYPNQ